MEILIASLIQILGILALISVIYLIHAFYQSQKKRAVNKKMMWAAVTVLAAYVLLAIASTVFISFIATSSLGEARQMAQDASTKANLSSLSVAALLYFDANKSYSGFCDDTASLESFKAKLTADDQKKYVCNDSVDQWAVSIPVGSAVYLCIDNAAQQPIEIRSALKNQTVCQ